MQASSRFLLRLWYTSSYEQKEGREKREREGKERQKEKKGRKERMNGNCCSSVCFLASKLRLNSGPVFGRFSFLAVNLCLSLSTRASQALIPHVDQMVLLDVSCIFTWGFSALSLLVIET